MMYNSLRIVEYVSLDGNKPLLQVREGNIDESGKSKRERVLRQRSQTF